MALFTRRAAVTRHTVMARMLFLFKQRASRDDDYPVNPLIVAA